MIRRLLRAALVLALVLAPVAAGQRPASADFGVTNLIGFGVGGAAPLTAFTFVQARTVGDSNTIDLTGEVEAGDLIVMLNFAKNTSGIPTQVVPTGFTGLQANGAGTVRGQISAKIAVGDEGVITIMSGTSLQKAIAAIFHPDAPITGFVWNSPNGEATTTNPTAQNIDASPATPPIILIGQMGSSGVISPRTTSPAMTELLNDTNHYAHYTIVNVGGTPADNSYDMDDEGEQVIQSGYLTFTQ